ncbi:MAG: quinohemoprotein amine dehydrogenase subunit alpha [Gemmatimonadaceae bacterium]
MVRAGRVPELPNTHEDAGMPRLRLQWVALAKRVIAASLVAGAAIGAQQKDTTSGFPIRDRLVVDQCTKCHTQDSTGRISRISYERKTPEGWEMSIRRMVSLNGAKLDPAAARSVLRYLADHQGLAPDEARAGRFESERRMIDYRYTGDLKTETTCKACHSLGRVITQRRTKEEWELLLATHRGLYPDVDFQAFRRVGPPPDSGDASHPMDHAISHLASAFPLKTPEWTAWSATMRTARLEGEWQLSGVEPGKGPFFGHVTITPVSGSDGEFTTQATYQYARGGNATRSGRSIVYTGFQWRGRSTEQGKGDEAQMREVMFVEPGWQEMSGRWFGGGYDELGMDVTLRRIGGGPMVAGVSQRGLRAGTESDVTIFGVNLPDGLTPVAVDFGPGVTVSAVTRRSSDAVTAHVRVDAGAANGTRDLLVGGVSLRNAVVVYDKISRVKVLPQAGMARVGGVSFPKQLQQFDAVAMNDGEDGKPDTPDDLNLGPVPVTWGLEEYGVTYDDDDVKFVGTIDANGLFTPNVEGPNPARAGRRNNVGDVWVVATYAADATRPMRGRAHLLVTVPLYMRWDRSGPSAATNAGKPVPGSEGNHR